MRNLLLARSNTFYHDYTVVVAAGSAAGMGVDALKPVQRAMADPLGQKTITLSCGKLTTGVSVKPWTGILMLRNSSSPETYFQAAFRVQTPWTSRSDDPNRDDILKQECYVFDFAPDRALRQIAQYSDRLNPGETNPEANVGEFIKFLPVLAYDGSTMKEISAAEVLDIAMSGTSATLLARRWESALLVNVDNVTLQRLLNSEAAMKALANIEGFRSLNQDIETIINKSDAIKKAKEKANKGKLTTGVSVKPWTGMLMLRNSSSPETYFQAAFRVQTPWTARDPRVRPARRHPAVGARPVPQSHRPDPVRFRVIGELGRLQPSADERRRLQVQTLRRRQPELHRP